MFDVAPQDIRDAAFGIDIPAGEAVDAQLERLIAKAEMRLATVLPTVASRIEAGALDVDLVRGVIEDMVLRVVKNPRSLRTLGLDDFQATIDNSTSTGLLYVTADEVALLSPRRPRRSVGTIRLGIERWRQPGA